MQKIIECVPNFSEGRNLEVIKKITDEIEKIKGVKLLDIDPGAATNRTVVTFVGTPESVIEAAFQAVKRASELIDMRNHKGAHPRMGATDVCPLIPVSGISMEETVKYARELAKRIGEKLEIPVFCYENAAFTEERRNLANIRSGEYEGMEKKLKNPDWKPDFGPASFNPKAGATNVGARDFLVAYNVNLNTTSTRRANAIAFDVREKGRVKREGNPLTGKPVLNEKGEKVFIPGSLKSVKGIGWYIEEYGIAQISLNLTNISVTPIHKAFDEVCERARARGLRVTGSELVGLVPLQAMIDAGKHYLRKQNRSVGIAEEEIIKIAIKSLGLDDLKPFNPKEKIIEYMLSDSDKKELKDLTVKDFANETASESPAPGGGSVAANMGALGVALATMVANLSSHKRGWDERWEEFSNWAEKGQALKDRLIWLIDEDTRAFNKIMDAFSMPKTNELEKKKRKEAIANATQYAIEIPFEVMKTAFAGFEIAEAMAKDGNPNSVSDAGVGALAIRAAIKGAFLNVKINAKDFDDKAFIDKILTEAKTIDKQAEQKENDIIQLVEKVINA